MTIPVYAEVQGPNGMSTFYTLPDDLRTQYLNARERVVQISNRSLIGWGFAAVLGIGTFLTGLDLVNKEEDEKASFSLLSGGAVVGAISTVFFFRKWRNQNEIRADLLHCRREIAQRAVGVHDGSEAWAGVERIDPVDRQNNSFIIPVTVRDRLPASYGATHSQDETTDSFSLADSDKYIELLD